MELNASADLEYDEGTAIQTNNNNGEGRQYSNLVLWVDRRSLHRERKVFKEVGLELVALTDNEAVLETLKGDDISKIIAVVTNMTRPLKNNPKKINKTAGYIHIYIYIYIYIYEFPVCGFFMCFLLYVFQSVCALCVLCICVFF